MVKRDPTLFKVRESDLPRAYRKHGETIDGRRTHHWWSSDGDWVANEVETAEEVRRQIKHHLQKIARYEAAARAIEEEGRMVDPEVRAQALWEEVREGEYQVTTWGEVGCQVRDEYRKIAAHTIKREARNG